MKRRERRLILFCYIAYITNDLKLHHSSQNVWPGRGDTLARIYTL